MARRSLGKVAKVLGGLGAMYALSKLPVGERVRPEDVNQEDAAKYRRDLEQRLAQLRAPAPAEPESVQPRVRLPDPNEHYVREDTSLSRIRLPLFGLEEFEVRKKKGGVVSASRRGDGIAQRGKTRGKMV